MSCVWRPVLIRSRVGLSNVSCAESRVSVACSLRGTARSPAWFCLLRLWRNSVAAAPPRGLQLYEGSMLPVRRVASSPRARVPFLIVQPGNPGMRETSDNLLGESGAESSHAARLSLVGRGNVSCAESRVSAACSLQRPARSPACFCLLRFSAQFGGCCFFAWTAALRRSHATCSPSGI